jgi:hypothetical protein
MSVGNISSYLITKQCLVKLPIEYIFLFRHKLIYISLKISYFFNVHGSVHRNNTLVYKSQQDAQVTEFFNLTTALHVSGFTITHLQEHKATVTTASGNSETRNM